MNNQFYKMRLLKHTFSISSSKSEIRIFTVVFPSFYRNRFFKKYLPASIYKDKGSKGVKSEINTEIS